MDNAQKQKGIYLSPDSDFVLMMTFAELYNGTGYTDYHDVASPYIFSGTEAYEKGKYVKDGSFSAKTVDKQPGLYIL